MRGIFSTTILLAIFSFAQFDDFLVVATPRYNTVCNINAPTKHAGGKWQYVLDEDFNGKELNPDIWTARQSVEVGHLRELQYYRPENVEVNNGLLLLHTKEERYENWSYTSGWVDSNFKFGIRYGRVCVRARLPAQQPGFHPAHWLMPLSETCWPGAGEIDVMEMLSGDGVVHATYHYNKNYTRIGCNNNSAEEGTSVFNIEDPSFSDSFHEYAVEWTEESLTYFVDGKPYLSLYPSDKEMDSVSQTPMYFIINNALGRWAGRVTNATGFPIVHEIDYIRIMQDSSEKGSEVVLPNHKKNADHAGNEFARSTLEVLNQRSLFRRKV